MGAFEGLKGLVGDFYFNITTKKKSVFNDRSKALKYFLETNVNQKLPKHFTLQCHADSNQFPVYNRSDQRIKDFLSYVPTFPIFPSFLKQIHLKQ